VKDAADIFPTPRSKMQISNLIDSTYHAFKGLQYVSNVTTP